MDINEQLKEKMGINTNKVNTFISQLFTAYVQTHTFHLQVKGKGSFAIHMALNELYEAIPGFIDEIVESYQGKYGIITDYKVNNISNFTDKLQIITYLKNLHLFIDNNREKLFQDSDILGVIDEIKTVIKQTLHKLENLE